MHAPTVTHLDVVKRILRYLKGFYWSRNSYEEQRYYTDHRIIDVDWVNNALDRKSHLLEEI